MLFTVRDDRSNLRSGFRVQGSGFRFRVQGSGFRVQVYDFFRIMVSGFRCMVDGSGFRVQVYGLHCISCNRSLGRFSSDAPPKGKNCWNHLQLQSPPHARVHEGVQV